MSARAAGLCLLLAALAAPVRAQCAGEWVARDPSALRVIVLSEGGADPSVARAVAALGANAVAGPSPPDPEAGANLAAAGLGYIAKMSVRDAQRLPFDSASLARIRSIPGLLGIQYFDDTAAEGYASADTQASAYGILKALFPDLLILYATRLDPVATDPGFLDDHFRPEFTDLVTPYFYPVGSTVLGAQQEGDPWEERLRSLLSPVAQRTPAGKGLLPVLQAFEQAGFPAGGGLVRRQLAVYTELWPDNRNAAAFWWGGDIDEPLTGLSQRPALRRAVGEIFGSVPARPTPCLAAPRPPPELDRGVLGGVGVGVGLAPLGRGRR